jgi:hypothetical protein
MVKYLIIFLVFFSAELMSKGEADITLYGECYVAEFIYSDPYDKNVNTICINGEVATSRMIFSNTGNLSAVCYQQGHAKVISSKEFYLDFKEGYCDNSKSFSPDKIACKESAPKVFKCNGPNGKMTLKYIGEYG